MGFGMRRRGGRRGRRRIGRRFHTRRRRFGRRGGARLSINLFACCFAGSQVEAVGTNGEIHKNVLDLQQQQTYLLQERQIVDQCVQSSDPAEKRKGEATRKSEQERFQTIAENQKATYDEAVAVQPTVTDPDSARQLAEDIAAIVAQVQYLQSLGYEYLEGIPGQPADQQPPQRKQLGGICVICTKPLLDFQFKCYHCPWLSICTECQSRGIHNEHAEGLRRTDKTCSETMMLKSDDIAALS